MCVNVWWWWWLLLLLMMMNCVVLPAWWIDVPYDDLGELVNYQPHFFATSSSSLGEDTKRRWR